MTMYTCHIVRPFHLQMTAFMRILFIIYYIQDTNPLVKDLQSFFYIFAVRIPYNYLDAVS
jgi:hypothetical protein